MSTDTARTSVAKRRIRTVADGRARGRVDALAVEEPLEIRACGPGQEPARVAVTMRTPGDDFALAVGFLVTEGLLDPRDVAAVSYCEDPDVQRYNVVSVRSRTPFDAGAAERNFFATSSCGICGKASLEAVAVRCNPLDPAAGPMLDGDVLLAMPASLRQAQRVFGRTGGLHAAGLFTAAGDLVTAREDVGRHNAVDKVVGAGILDGVSAAGAVMVVSGRLSFEIVQKAAVAGISVICAISAPSSLAVDAAAELGVTAVGFLRDGSFNIYTHPERIMGLV